MPFRQAQEGVHPDDEAKAAVRIFVPQLRERLDGIGGTLFADLAIIDHKTRLIGGRELAPF